MIAVMILWESPTKYQTITFIMNGSDYSAITCLYIGSIGWDLLHPEHIIKHIAGEKAITSVQVALKM
jgi:hypothetical protein